MTDIEKKVLDKVADGERLTIKEEQVYYKLMQENVYEEDGERKRHWKFM